MSRFGHVARNELRLMGTDPLPLVLLLAMPSFVALFIRHGFVGGPAYAITGVGALFGALGVLAVGNAFYRDHGWGTWDRLRASPAGAAEIVLGKTLPLAALFAGQQLVLLAVGRLALGMPWRGSVLAAALLVAGIVGAEVGIGLLLTAFCTTINQVNAVGTLAGVLLAGLGGALAPVASLPAPARAIAGVSPSFWALRGLRAVLERGAGAGAVGTDVAVLLGFAAASIALALWRLRFEEPKAFYA
jgi:ABC-2 type transport system permease protein